MRATESGFAFWAGVVLECRERCGGHEDEAFRDGTTEGWRFGRDIHHVGLAGSCEVGEFFEHGTIRTLMGKIAKS